LPALHRFARLRESEASAPIDKAANYQYLHLISKICDLAVFHYPEAFMSRTEVRQQWRAILAEDEQCDSSISEYCRRHHINPAPFYQWRKKLAADQPGRLLAVVIEQRANPVRVCFSNNAILEVQEHGSLAALQLAVAVLS
jgi:hypothetical protein